MRLGLSSAHIFSWIFIFQYFLLFDTAANALGRVTLLYALTYIIQCLATPYAAKLLRSGLKRALTFATTTVAIAFIILGALFTGAFGYPDIGIVLFAILIGIYRALYWIPYALASSSVSRGAPPVFRELLIALAPLIAGFAIAYSPASAVSVLMLAGIFILLSNLPLLRMEEVYENYSWGYRETFVRLIAPENRSVLLHGVLDGVVGASLLFLWPLAIFDILEGSYALLGIVLTITFLFTILMRKIVRGGLKYMRLHESKLLHTLFLLSPWVLRTLVATPLGIVLVDTYFYTTAPARQGMDPFAFEQSVDGGTFLDEFTALKEMAQALGRIGVCFIAGIFAYTTSYAFAFIAVFAVAALVSIFVALRDQATD